MEHYDVVVVGSGMGGSSCSLMLAKLGYRVALLERGSHPRFAIGESATPVMSQKLRYLGEAYDIPEFISLSTYDRIKGADVPITCGAKELFHYFIHQEGQTEVSINGSIPEIIVQTSEVDAQYLRADSDEYLVKVAQKYGVEYLDQTSVIRLDFFESRAEIDCVRGGQKFGMTAEFVIDATGFNSIIGQKYKMKIHGGDLNSPLKSRSIFTHFKGVGDFEKKLNESPDFMDRSPAPRIGATQHHCFVGGWLWIIPFDNGITSVGLNLDIDVFPENDREASSEFYEIISRYPIIKEILSGAEPVMPWVKTGRLQFLNNELVGDRWAMLPASAYGLDAWFSTGLAVSFIAIHRLVDSLHNKILPERNFARQSLLEYEQLIKKEYYHASKMVNGIYKSFKHFDVFRNYCFICFMGAENFLEQGGVYHAMNSKHLLLSAGDNEFVEKFNKIYEKVIHLSAQESVKNEDIVYLNKFIREDMKAFNLRDYGNEELKCMHVRRPLKKREMSIA